MIFLTATAWLVSWSFAELGQKVNTELFAKMEGNRTKRDRMRPCRRAADRCICEMLAEAEVTRWGMCWAPAGNLESGAKNLGAYEFRHGGWWCLWQCDRRGVEDVG